RELGIDVRLDRTLPAFTRCSLDDNPGDGSPESGAGEGQSNLYLTWETSGDSVVDEVGRWSLMLRLGKQAPKDGCTVDVTPRRPHGAGRRRALPGQLLPLPGRDALGTPGPAQRGGAGVPLA